MNRHIKLLVKLLDNVKLLKISVNSYKVLWMLGKKWKLLNEKMKNYKEFLTLEKILANKFKLKISSTKTFFKDLLKNIKDCFQ